MSKVSGLKEAVATGSGGWRVRGHGMGSGISYPLCGWIRDHPAEEKRADPDRPDFRHPVRPAYRRGLCKKGCHRLGRECGCRVGHNFRRAMEEGSPRPLQIEEHSNFTLGLGLKAAAMGLPLSSDPYRPRERLQP